MFGVKGAGKMMQEQKLRTNLERLIKELEQEQIDEPNCKELEGIIVKLVPTKGFGFIRTNEGDLYFHASGVIEEAFEDLRVGMRVECIKYRDPTKSGERAVKAIGVTVAM